MNTPQICLLFKKSLVVLALSSALSSFSSFAAEDKANESIEDIEIITVKGRAAQFYFVGESTMATKTPTDYMDLPQSIQVLSQELITDQAARQTTDLYRSISGVTQFSYSGVTARGFRQDQAIYDGVQGDPFSEFGIPQLFNIERVEVLKGPTGMLYGAGQPGGLLNYVTKKPKFYNETKVALITGNDSLLCGFFDSTGSINKNETLAYRVAAYHQNKDSSRNNADEENTILSASLTWLVNDATDLTFQYDHISQKLGGSRLRGVPVDDNGNFLTDISYNANEKADFQHLEADVFQVIANTEISNNLTNTTVFRTFSNKRTQEYHENLGLVGDLDPATKAATVPLLGFLGFPAEDSAMLRQFRDQKRNNDEWSLTTDFVYEASFYDMEHTLLFGLNYSDVDKKEDLKYSDLLRTNSSIDFANPNPNRHVATLDILNPLYVADTSAYTRIEANYGKNNVSNNRLGIYVQDQVRINEQWIVIAGLRFDKYEDKNNETNVKIKDDNVSPRIGAIYQPNENTSIFINRSEGFSPQVDTTVPASENIFSPEISIQHEIGIKNEWLDGNLHTTFTAYHIVKEDLTVSNPNFVQGTDTPEQLQIGEVTSKGIEVDIVGDITENWTGTINYAYNDATITGESPESIRNAVGDEFVNAPDHTLGIWTRYALPSLSSSVAFGTDYVSERISLSGQKVKSYTTWDASWQTEVNNFTVQVNLKNIFDKEYATSGFNKRNGHFPGERRSIFLQVSYSL